MIEIGIAYAVLGASLSIALAGIGTIIGTKYIALGSTGFVAENPKNFGVSLLLTALPSSQGIYGFLGAILIIQKAGLLGGELIAIDPNTGLTLLASSLSVGLLGLFSGMGQGKVLQAGLKIVAKDAKNVGQTIILGVLMESMAVFGLLLTILVINGI